MLVASHSSAAGERRARNPCTPKARVIEIARAAAGPDYRQDPAPRVRRDGDTCLVAVWRIPKAPGGFRLVTIGGDGKVLRVEAGH